MRSLKKTRRIQIIVLAFVSLAIATGLIGYAMRDGFNFFRSPSQVIAEPPSPSEVFRIGGLVAEGSIVRGQGEQVQPMLISKTRGRESRQATCERTTCPRTTMVTRSSNLT